MQVSLPLEKINNLRQTVQLILSKAQITRRQAMRFLGKINHVVQAVPEARLHFKIFKEKIDFHVQKSVRHFQVIHSFRGCQRGPCMVGKPK